MDVTPTNDTVRAGLTTQLTATPRDADGNALSGRTIEWMSDDETIAGVSGSGLVTGVDNGVATITATSEGQSGTAGVQVWAGVSGFWTDTVPAATFDAFCGMTMNLDESTAAAITGSGTIGAPDCGTFNFTVAGSNNVGGVADSVTFTVTIDGLCSWDFAGNFDGASALDGPQNGGDTFFDDIATFTRQNLPAPAPPPPAVAARSSGSTLLKR